MVIVHLSSIPLNWIAQHRPISGCTSTTPGLAWIGPRVKQNMVSTLAKVGQASNQCMDVLFSFAFFETPTKMHELTGFP